MGWKNPKPGDLSDDGLRATLKSLEDFLRDPVFENGVSLGDGSQATYDNTLGVTTPPTTLLVTAGPWVAYAPSNTNVTVGNGTLYAQYMLAGKTCHVVWNLTWGSTTAFGGTVSIGLPFAAVTGPRQSLACLIVDSGTRNFVGVGKISSGASVADVVHSESGNLGTVNGTNPMTWTTGDSLTVSGAYQIA